MKGSEIMANGEKMNDDLISRQAAIDTIENTDWYHLNAKGEMVSGANSAGHQAWYKADDIYKVLEELPSAQPERKKGRWNTDKESPEYATCSVCGHCDWDCTESEYFKYCPNCGAQMGSE